jgi:hypothetical protein
MLDFTLYLKSHQRYLKNENIFEISMKNCFRSDNEDIILAIPKICKTHVYSGFSLPPHIQ